MSAVKTGHWPGTVMVEKLAAVGAVLLLVLVAAGGIQVAPVRAQEAALFEQQQPLVVVFDTSGSMAEADPSGHNKLETAKSLMTTLVRERGAGVQLGMWTYPGGSQVDGCKVGSWVPQLRPVDHPDPTNVDANIRKLTADGETPTGPALLAVVQALKEQGYSSARLVLVTDGESNCGIDPCEVATQILDEGFDLEVHAVAFDKKGQSNAEIQCIAKVTGGTFTTADDAAQLFEALQRFEHKDLDVKVSAPSAVQAGEMFAVTATVTNPNDQPAVGTTLVLSTDAESKVRYNSPVRNPLPVLPPGGSETRTWYLVTTADTAAPKIEWKVSAGVPGEGATTTGGSTTLLHQPLTRADAGPVLAPRNGTVVVLGDAYSAGTGTTTTTDKAECPDNAASYGDVLGGQDTKIIACAGVPITAASSQTEPDQPTQLQALADALAAPERPLVPDVVLMTVGSKEVGLGEILSSCALLDDCTRNERIYRDQIIALGNAKTDTLAQLYLQISMQVNTTQILNARDGLAVPLVISPYPDPFWEPTRGTCSGVFNSAELRMIKQLFNQLNAIIYSQVEKVRAAGYPVFYAEPVIDMALGHSSCTSDPYFVNVDPANVLNTPGLLQPNARGYEAWARTLVTWSQAEAVKEQPLTFPTSEKAAKLKEFLQQGQHYLFKNLLAQDVDLSGAELKPATDGTNYRQDRIVGVSPDSAVQLDFGGLKPGSPVQVVAKSNPVHVGTLIVDENGKVQGKMQLPQLPNGAHTLQITGWDQDGQLVALEVPIRAGSGVPVFIVVVLVICIISAGAGGALLRKRRKLKQQLAQLGA